MIRNYMKISSLEVFQLTSGLSNGRAVVSVHETLAQYSDSIYGISIRSKNGEVTNFYVEV